MSPSEVMCTDETAVDVAHIQVSHNRFNQTAPRRRIRHLDREVNVSDIRSTLIIFLNVDENRSAQTLRDNGGRQVLREKR